MAATPELQLAASGDIRDYLKQHERKGILRFLTCGSVDDGKSTLIGRLLHDAELIYDDQLDAIRRDSKTAGTQRDGVDLALLVDGLQAEREQGITIDVAYRYFATARRKFIIADTPGHVQYTRNMATGASSSDVAVILIDARNGVLPQTRRHSFIARLLGIRHLIAAVNKMDEVGYAERVFDEIRNDYFDFASRLAVDDLHFIPISALHGDNVVHPSTHMPWYRGATMMHLLETIQVALDKDAERFRLPVQFVNRPDAAFRGYSGTIVGGTIRPGDPVAVLPSGKSSTVLRIVTMDGDLDEAFAPMAVSLTLADELDVSRGDVIVAPRELPHTANRIDADLVWMSEEDLVPGKTYTIKQGTRRVTGRVRSVRFRVDVDTLGHEPASTLRLNEIGRGELVLNEPVVFESYVTNRSLGSLILIDRLTNATVAAGMVLPPGGSVHAAAWDDAPHGDLHAAVSPVDMHERETRLGQRPVTVLLTGLAKSGKTVIAHAVERKLFDAGHLATVLDGQTFRLGMSRDLGFSAEERSENVRRAAETARLMNDAGLICLTAFVAPEEAVRERAREAVGADRFIEVYLHAPLDVLKERDEYGLYEAAAQGEANVPGVNADFEEPESPDLVLQTHSLAVDACANAIIALLRRRGYISERF
ncbi:MAG: sulfate adenylyltransferase subunit CysN [Gammaproteobacteria bacterium]|nr:sulfate adenylyltransferase subunit CysN [Gammaproteobacteria bacterium]